MDKLIKKSKLNYEEYLKEKLNTKHMSDKGTKKLLEHLLKL